MTEKPNLSRLTVGIVDEVGAIQRRQEILKLCKEQLNSFDKASWQRCGLLLDSYLSETECSFNQLDWYFKELKVRIKELGLAIILDLVDEEES